MFLSSVKYPSLCFPVWQTPRLQITSQLSANTKPDEAPERISQSEEFLSTVNWSQVSCQRGGDIDLMSHTQLHDNTEKERGHLFTDWWQADTRKEVIDQRLHLCIISKSDQSHLRRYPVILHSSHVDTIKTEARLKKYWCQMFPTAMGRKQKHRNDLIRSWSN